MRTVTKVDGRQGLDVGPVGKAGVGMRLELETPVMGTAETQKDRLGEGQEGGGVTICHHSPGQWPTLPGFIFTLT